MLILNIVKNTLILYYISKIWFLDYLYAYFFKLDKYKV